MKNFSRSLLVAVSLFVSSQGFAQISGLPIGNSVKPIEPGAFSLGLNGMVGMDDIERLYGVRAQYGFAEGLMGYLDIGGSQFEGFDDTFALQLGGQMSLYVADGLDSGLRLSAYMNGEESRFIEGSLYTRDAYGLNLSFVAGGDCSNIMPGMEYYGAFGLDYMNTDESYSGPAVLNPPEETTILIAGGVSTPITPTTEGFLEIAYRDGLLIGIGVSFDF